MEKFLKFLKDNIPVLFVIVSFFCLIIFGYLEYLYYSKVMPNFGWQIHYGAPIMIESMKFVLLLGTFMQILNSMTNGNWGAIQVVAIIIGLIISGYILYYQFQEVEEMKKNLGDNIPIENFSRFCIIASNLLEIRLVFYLLKK